MRRALSLLVVAALALTLVAGASAKSFALVAADVQVQVAKDGTLLVDEHIQYAFSGPFSGGFRDVALRRGESVSDVKVSEDGRAYRPGGCPKLGCSDAAGTFGVKQMADRARIVWHYSASNEVRTFQIHYALRGVPVAYDDVVDVNLEVWGDEWDVGLGS